MVTAHLCMFTENLIVNGKNIEQVSKYTYLGTMINCHNDYTNEIKIRIEKGRANFTKMKGVLCGRDLNLNLRVRLVKCYIFSTLLYGMEAWTLNAVTLKKLEAFEMWVYRRILRISWTDRVTNTEVLRRMGKAKELIETIKSRKLEYLGHVARGAIYSLLRLIMQGKIQGKRSVGRRRISWLRNLREWFGCSSCDLFRAAASKIKLAMMIANLRRGDGT